MIRHVVLLELAKGAEHRNLSAVMEGLAELTNLIPGFEDFAHGPNRDFEQKSTAYTHGFVCTFADQAALQVARYSRSGGGPPNSGWAPGKCRRAAGRRDPP